MLNLDPINAVKTPVLFSCALKIFHLKKKDYKTYSNTFRLTFDNFHDAESFARYFNMADRKGKNLRKEDKDYLTPSKPSQKERDVISLILY